MLKTVIELIVKAESTGDKVARVMLIVGLVGVIQVVKIMYAM